MFGRLGFRQSGEAMNSWTYADSHDLMRERFFHFYAYRLVFLIVAILVAFSIFYIRMAVSKLNDFFQSPS